MMFFLLHVHKIFITIVKSGLTGCMTWISNCEFFAAVDLSFLNSINLRCLGHSFNCLGSFTLGSQHCGLHMSPGAHIQDHQFLCLRITSSIVVEIEAGLHSTWILVLLKFCALIVFQFTTIAQNDAVRYQLAKSWVQQLPFCVLCSFASMFEDSNLRNNSSSKRYWLRAGLYAFLQAMSVLYRNRLEAASQWRVLVSLLIRILSRP